MLIKSTSVVIVIDSTRRMTDRFLLLASHLFVLFSSLLCSSHFVSSHFVSSRLVLALTRTSTLRLSLSLGLGPPSPPALMDISRPTTQLHNYTHTDIMLMHSSQISLLHHRLSYSPRPLSQPPYSCTASLTVALTSSLPSGKCGLPSRTASAQGFLNTSDQPQP